MPVCFHFCARAGFVFIAWPRRPAPRDLALRISAALHWRLIGPFRGGRALAVTGVPGRAESLLLRRGRRRRVGEPRCRAHVESDLRRSRHRIDRRDRRRAEQLRARSTSAPARPTCVPTSRTATACTSRPTAERRWTHIGLDDTRQIGAIVVDPHNANVAYVAALGHPYGAERRTRRLQNDRRRKNLEQSALQKSRHRRDLAGDRAGQSQRASMPRFGKRAARRGTSIRRRTAPAAGSTNRPTAARRGRSSATAFPRTSDASALSISAAAPHRVYAHRRQPTPQQGGVYRSDDAGATWTHTDGDARIWQRGWYFGGITADPRNPDVVYVMNTATYRSTDGGKSFDAVLGDPTGDDYHTLWIDPNDPNRMILGSDQGVIVSVNGAADLELVVQPADRRSSITSPPTIAFPFWAYGAQQDSGAAMQPSRSKYGTISQQDFRPVDVGGENGDARARSRASRPRLRRLERSRRPTVTRSSSDGLGAERRSDHHPSRNALAQHLDAADRVLAGRPHVALLRPSERLPFARRRRDVEHRQPRSLARERGHADESRPDDAGRQQRHPPPRRRLYDRAVAAARERRLGRHRRRLRLADARRRRAPGTTSRRRH